MAQQPAITRATGGNDIPLRALYLQIEYGNTPTAVLGISSQPTDLELRESHHALPLRIHPDRAPSANFQELHTSHFQKVQAAYDELLKSHFHQSSDDQITQPKRLQEDFASLHARNVAFREALRDKRERALKSKHAAEAREAANEANLKAKNEKLAQRREARAQMLQQAREKKEAEAERRSKERAKQLRQTAVKNENGAECLS